MKTPRTVACAVALLLMVMDAAAAGEAGSAAALRAQFSALKDSFGNNPFHRPLHMESVEGPEGVAGEIHAIVGHPFATARAALVQAPQWCDVLILHLNTKFCRPATAGKATVLHVIIGKKFDQPVADAYRVDFVYRVAASSADYFQVNLDAREGPLGTRDYRVMLEATPGDGGRTLVRLAYSYSFGMAGRLAMQAYLATAGRDKVGFTVVGQEPGSPPRYIGGMRGLVERNTMRYYLAIEAFVGALSAPASARLEKSLGDWYTATELFARQLHEMERGDYLAMKRKEHARQQSDLVSGPAPARDAGG